MALWTGLGRRWGILKTFAVASVVEAVGVAASALWLHALGVIVAALFVGGTFMGLTALGLIAAQEAGLPVEPSAGPANQSQPHA